MYLANISPSSAGDHSRYLNLAPPDQEREKSDIATDPIMQRGRSKILELEEEYDTDVDVENCPDLTLATAYVVQRATMTSFPNAQTRKPT